MIQKQITTENQVITELFDYLWHLKSAFKTAIDKFNSGEILYVLPNGLTISQVYGDSSNMNLRIDEDRLDQLAYNLETAILNKDDYEDLFYLIKLEYNEYCFPKYKLTSEGLEIESAPENPLFRVFINLFETKIRNLLEKLLSSSLEKNWQILFENWSLKQTCSFLEKIEQQIQSQRKVSTLYYGLFLRMALFMDERPSDENDFFPGLFQSKLGLKQALTQEHTKLIRLKIDQYYSKLTLLESRDLFLNRLKRIFEIDQNLLLFIENCFHFDGAVYTSKIRKHDAPNVSATTLALFLRIYFEKKKIMEVNKKDLILWLVFEFYGIRGFRFDNIRGIFVGSNSKIRSFKRKYSVALEGL